jgi:NADH:ubiquinone oxidoreductase subunit
VWSWSRCRATAIPTGMAGWTHHNIATLRQQNMNRVRGLNKMYVCVQKMRTYRQFLGANSRQDIST